MGLVFIVWFDPGQSFNIISLLFSIYTISLNTCVFGEQRGGAAEILTWIEGDKGN
jgi:hypothetical protein